MNFLKRWLLVFACAAMGLGTVSVCAQDGAGIDSSIIVRQVMVERLMEERVQAALKTILGPIDSTVVVRTEWIPKPKSGSTDNTQNMARRGLALPGVPINPEITKRGTDASASLLTQYERRVHATIFLPYAMGSSKMEVVNQTVSAILELDPAVGDKVEFKELGRKPIELKKAFWDTMNWEAVMRGVTLLMWILVIAFLFGPLSRYLKVAPQITDVEHKGGGPSPLESALAPMGGGAGGGGGGGGGETTLGGAGGSITVTQGSGDMFTFVNKENLKALAGVLVKEPPQITAIVLQVLPRKVASQLLTQLPVKMQIGLLLQFKRVKYGNPDYVKEIDRKLRSQMGFQMGGIDQARRILQSVPGSPRKSLLQMIASADKEYCQKLEESLFELKDLLLYDSKAIARIFRDAGVVTFARVLKMSDQAFRKEILSKLHPSVARLLDEQIHMMQEVDSTLVEDEMLRIADTVERLGADGTIPPVSDMKAAKKPAAGSHPPGAAGEPARKPGGAPGKALGGKAKVAGLAIALLLGGLQPASALTAMLVGSSNTFTSGAEGNNVFQYGSYIYVAGKTESPDGFFIQKMNEFFVTVSSITSTEAQSAGSYYSVGLTGDSSGNLYLCSAVSGNVAVFKYDSSLNFIASATYAGNNDVANVIKMDSSGNLIVAGAANNNIQLLVMKLSPELVLLDRKAETNGVATGMGFDSSGNIYISNWVPGGTQYRIAKFQNGSTTITKIKDAVYNESGAPGLQWAGGILVAPDDLIYVSGMIGTVGDSKAVTVMFDTDLTTWRSSDAVTSGGFTMGRSLAYDSADNGRIIVAGVSYSSTTSKYQYMVRKYTTMLGELKNADDYAIGGAGGSTEGAYSVLLDRNSNVIVTGRNNSQAFTLLYFGPPVIKTASEAHQGDTYTVDITGRNFAPGVAVIISDALMGAVNYMDSTHISLDVDLPIWKPIGRLTVSVMNPDGQQATLQDGMQVVRETARLSTSLSNTIESNTSFGTMTVVFPAATFASDYIIRLSIPYTTPPASEGYAGTGVSLQIDSTVDLANSASYNLIMMYREADVVGVDQKKLIMAGYNYLTSAWVKFTSTPVPSLRTVSAAVNRLGLFSILSPSSSPTPAPDTTRTDVFMYPNPYKPGSGGSYDNPSGVEGVILANLPKSTAYKLQVLDAAGEEVYYNSETADANGQGIWKVQSTGGIPLASGVYFYIVRDGGGTELRKGKFAVIR